VACNNAITLLNDDPELLRHAAVYVESADTGLRARIELSTRRSEDPETLADYEAIRKEALDDAHAFLVSMADPAGLIDVAAKPLGDAFSDFVGDGASYSANRTLFTRLRNQLMMDGLLEEVGRGSAKRYRLRSYPLAA
jgi:hypothetical protein